MIILSNMILDSACYDALRSSCDCQILDHYTGTVARNVTEDRTECKGG